jgi:outer membrane protein
MNRNIVGALALLCLGGWAAPLRAATLDDCYQYALAQSETLANSRESVVQAEQMYHQALGAVMPNASLNYTYLRQDDHAYTPILNEFNPNNQQTWNVTLQQPLFRGFSEYAALRQEKDSLVSARDAHRWAAMQIYQDVAQAFFMVLSLENSREIIEDEIKDYDGRIKEEQDFYAIGRARASDVETVQADQALLRATAVQTDEQIAVEREILAFLTGKGETLQLEATDQAPADPGDLDALMRGLDKRPDIHAALVQNEAAKEFVKVNEGAHLPSVDLLGHWYPIQRAGTNAPIDWDASISASLPLFEGFSLVAKDKQAESMQRQAEQNLYLARRQAVSALRTAWHTLSGDLAQIKADDQAYSLSTKAYTHLEADYKHGLDTNQDVLIAMTASWVAKQALETAGFTARNDYEQLQTLAGNRLDLFKDDQEQ